MLILSSCATKIPMTESEKQAAFKKESNKVYRFKQSRRDIRIVVVTLFISFSTAVWYEENIQKH